MVFCLHKVRSLLLACFLLLVVVGVGVGVGVDAGVGVGAAFYVFCDAGRAFVSLAVDYVHVQ